MLDSLFGPEKDNLQRKAAETALQKRLLIISGGPGCGKTWAAVRIIRLLKELAGQNVVLCAPTGKAAARLQSSLRETGGELLPGNVMTLHRLLKPVPDTPGFRHHAGNPLACDTLVVDEASMIDLPLFAKLTDAMPENGRLILLGDRHQLASVESGAALNDLCLAAQDPSSFLHGHLVELVKSMRFREGDAISVLGRLIREGRAEEAHAFAADQGLFHPARRDDPLGDLLLNKLSPFLESYSALEDPVAMLDRLDELKILCVLNVTPFGVDAVNERVERIFRPADPAAYPGMPILVLENDYRNGLFNGDSGVLFPDNGALKACFRSPEGGVRMFEPSRLPRHQKAWALTVHKSQGSEFGEAVLVLPGFDSPLLTRELLYTAVTRARRGIEIWGEKDLFIRGIRRKIRRFSGLADGLGPQPTPANRKSP